MRSPYTKYALAHPECIQTALGKASGHTPNAHAHPYISVDNDSCARCWSKAARSCKTQQYAGGRGERRIQQWQREDSLFHDVGQGVILENPALVPLPTSIQTYPNPGSEGAEPCPGPASLPLLTDFPGWSATMWRCHRRRGCVPAAHWQLECGAAPQTGQVAVTDGKCRAGKPAWQDAAEGKGHMVTTFHGTQCHHPHAQHLAWVQHYSCCPLSFQHTLARATRMLAIAGCSLFLPLTRSRPLPSPHLTAVPSYLQG